MLLKNSQSAPQDIAWGELMRKAQAGDADALRELYEGISPIILAFCTKRAGYLGIPEDALQASLLAIHRNRHVYLPSRSFKAWMFSIVRSKLIDELRKHNRIGKREKTTDFAVTSKTNQAYSNIRGEKIADIASADLLDSDQLEALRAAISSLPEKYRRAISLVKIEGYSVKEAAKSEKVSESSIKVRTHRGFKMLVKKLKTEDA